MPPTPWTPGNYLPAHRSGHIDVYTSASKGKVLVLDPYQWMEENSDEVDKWMTAQAAFTQAYLDQNADRQKLEDKFRASTNYAKVITRPLCYIIIMLKSISCSSLRPLYLMTDTGIGSTTVVCSHNQVYIHLSLEYDSDADFERSTVLYRSKEPALPDFSKEDNEVGEVFFDVGNFTTSEKTSLTFRPPKAKCTCCRRWRCYGHLPILPLWQVLCIRNISFGE
jgi:prolyl oligopeptidase